MLKEALMALYALVLMILVFVAGRLSAQQKPLSTVAVIIGIVWLIGFLGAHY